MYTPVFSSDGTTSRVTDFLALADPDGVVGDNIVAVWYERSATDSTWSAKSWLTLDPAEAIKAVKIARGIPDSDDALWPASTPDAIAAVLNPETGKPYEGGVLLEDPLALTILESPVRNELVELLKEAGYKAASLETDKASETCPPMWMLCRFAIGIEGALNAPPATPDDATARAAELIAGTDEQAIGRFCREPGRISPRITTIEPVAPTFDTPWTRTSCYGTGAPASIGTQYCCWSRTVSTYQRRTIITEHPNGTVTLCVQERTVTWTQTRCGYTNSPSSEPAGDAAWMGNSSDPPSGGWSGCLPGGGGAQP